MPTSIYWIKLKEHTDIFTQGYVGVSKNVKERLRQHYKNAKGGYHSDKILSKAILKYGQEKLEEKIILISTNEYCYEIEKKLRPLAFIGWNMKEGGYHTPNPFPAGSKMPNQIVEKVKNTLKNKRIDCGVGKDRSVTVNGKLFYRISDARKAFGISKTQMTRILKGIKYNENKSGNTRFSHLEIKYADSQKT